MTLRPQRWASDGDSRVFFTTIDSEIPVVAGVTVVCGAPVEVSEVKTAAGRLGLRAEERRWADGRSAVVIGAAP